jgi:rhomboid family GlyGly-CTERM serine protease
MGLERLLRARAGDLVVPAALSVVLLAVFLAGSGAIHVLRYERAAVLAGEGWRLVTGHLVHADAAHLGWNLLGVGIVAALFAGDYPPRQWLLITLASLATINAAFLLLEPQLEWYLGFSGVLHGLMAAGLVAWLRASRDPFAWLVTGLFAAKLAWEHLAGPLPFTAESLSLPVIHAAHSYGAVGGTLAALWLAHRTRRAASL